jgi:hypothetical protein
MSDPFMDDDDTTLIGDEDSPNRKAQKSPDKQQFISDTTNTKSKATLDHLLTQPGGINYIYDTLSAAHRRMIASHQLEIEAKEDLEDRLAAMGMEMEKVRKELEAKEKAHEITKTLLKTRTTELVLANNAIQASQIHRGKRVEYLTSLVSRNERTIFEERKLRKEAEKDIERLWERVDQGKLATASEFSGRQEDRIAAKLREGKLKRKVRDLMEKNRDLASNLFPLQVVAGMGESGVVNMEEWRDFTHAITLLETVVKAMKDNWSYQDWPWGSKGTTKQRLIRLRARICSLY